VVGIGGDAAGGYLPKWYFKVCGAPTVTAEVINNTDVYFAPDAKHNLKGTDYFEGHVEEMKAFLRAARGGENLPVTLSDALRANYILELVKSSVESGTSVDFDKSILPESR
jgi:predicted dehydrogenase